MRCKNQRSGTELITGAALTIAVVTSSFYLSRQAIRFASRQSPDLGDAIELLWGWTCLAARSLEQEATSADDEGDLTLARARLARIVGRDTSTLTSAKSTEQSTRLSLKAPPTVLSPPLLHGPRRCSSRHGLQGSQHSRLHDRPRECSLLLFRQSCCTSRRCRQLPSGTSSTGAPASLQPHASSTRALLRQPGKTAT